MLYIIQIYLQFSINCSRTDDNVRRELCKKIPVNFKLAPFYPGWAACRHTAILPVTEKNLMIFLNLSRIIYAQLCMQQLGVVPRGFHVHYEIFNHGTLLLRTRFLSSISITSRGSDTLVFSASPTVPSLIWRKLSSCLLLRQNCDVLC